jgi:hypothetical protein
VWPLGDHQGTPQAMVWTNNSQSQPAVRVQQLAKDAFGTPLDVDDLSSDNIISNANELSPWLNLGMNGWHYDNDADLYLVNGRPYEPNSGRWVAQFAVQTVAKPGG